MSYRTRKEYQEIIDKQSDSEFIQNALNYYAIMYCKKMADENFDLCAVIIDRCMNIKTKLASGTLKVVYK